MFTIEQQQNFVKEFKSHGDNRVKEVKVANLNLKLARSILSSESMPQELLTETPSKILQQFEGESQSGGGVNAQVDEAKKWLVFNSP